MGNELERVERRGRGVGIEVLAKRVGGDCSVVRAEEVLEEYVERVDVLIRPLIDQGLI